MSEQNIAFEKWKWSAKLKVKQPLIYETNLIKEAFNAGYKAATAEANKMIAELDGEVAELKAENQSHHEYLNKLQLRDNQNRMHINQLREALEDIAKVNHSSAKCGEIAEQALATTPAQSLQAHDNEILEQVAVHLNENFYGDAADEVRALKQEVK